MSAPLAGITWALCGCLIERFLDFFWESNLQNRKCSCPLCLLWRFGCKQQTFTISCLTTDWNMAENRSVTQGSGCSRAEEQTRVRDQGNRESKTFSPPISPLYVSFFSLWSSLYLLSTTKKNRLPNVITYIFLLVYIFLFLHVFF